jgi:hypothetical protein
LLPESKPKKACFAKIEAKDFSNLN